MPLKTTGMVRNKRFLKQIAPEAVRQFEMANKENADLIVATAKALIPEDSGTSRRLIKTVPEEGTSQLIDFGPISRILEGGTQQRTTKAGKNAGKGPARPFKNPAMNGTQNKRNARNRKALKAAIAASK